MSLRIQNLRFGLSVIGTLAVWSIARWACVATDYCVPLTEAILSCEWHQKPGGFFCQRRCKSYYRLYFRCPWCLSNLRFSSILDASRFRADPMRLVQKFEHNSRNTLINALILYVDVCIDRERLLFESTFDTVQSCSLTFCALAHFWLAWSPRKLVGYVRLGK